MLCPDEKLEPHICQYCGAKTTQPDDECYAKPTPLQEAADKWVFETNGHRWSNNDATASDNYGSFIAGANYQTTQMYTENEVHAIIESYQNTVENNPEHIKYNDWFEQFSKLKNGTDK